MSADLSAAYACGKGDAKVIVCKLCDASSTRRSCQESYLHEIGLVYILNGHGFLADCGCQGIKSNRASCIILDYCLEQSTVDIVKTKLVNFKCFKRIACNIRGNSSVTLNKCKVSYSLK